MELDTIFLVLSYILVLFVGTVYGWNLRQRHAEKQLDNFMVRLDAEVQDKISQSVIYIDIEKQNGVFYVYDKKNKDFMGQGKDKEELEKNLAARFPNKKFLADSNNLKDMGL